MGFVRPTRRRRAWHPLVGFAPAIAVALGVAAYPATKVQRALDAQHPQRAGQPVNPYVMAAHIAGARVAAVAGDSRAAQGHVNAIAHDLARSARVPDVFRPIDHEAARTAVRPLTGVRSAVWLDADNFVAMVDGAQHRSMDMIDRVCLAPGLAANTAVSSGGTTAGDSVSFIRYVQCPGKLTNMVTRGHYT